MEALREAYNRIIESYDPYYIPEEEPTSSEILYNLREILNDLNEDETELRAKINSVLKFAEAAKAHKLLKVEV